MFDELGSYISCRKIEKTLRMKQEMDGKVFISNQSRHFFVDNRIKVLISILYLDLACKQLIMFPAKEKV